MALRSKLRRHILAGMCAQGVLAVPWVARASSGYPSRPITLIEPFSAGGAIDGIVRAIAERASATLGQPIVVDPRPGGGTRLGTDLIRRAEPNGYTLGVMVSASGVNIPALDATVSYDPLRDFTPLNIATEAGYVVVTHPESGIESIADLVRKSKEPGGRIAYGSSGVGTSSHVWVEVFQAMAGANFVHVPYKGEGPAITDLAGGHLEFTFSSPGVARPLVDAGKVRVIANAGQTPNKIFPDIPTLASMGYPDLNAAGWVGFVAPANVPTDITNKINHAFLDALKSPEVQRRTQDIGLDVVGIGPEGFARRIEDELKRVRQVGADRGISITG